MVLSKPFVAYTFLFFLIFFHLIEANEKTIFINPKEKIAKINCGAQCGMRCKLSSRPNLCKRACGTCCGRCNCVPPGTYGNYGSCPCYKNMTTRGGKHKCP